MHCEDLCEKYNAHLWGHYSEYTKKYETDEGKKDLESDLDRMKKYATVICVLAHTQVRFLVLIKSYRV
jgi:hypothetical protein